MRPPPEAQSHVIASEVRAWQSSIEIICVPAIGRFFSFRISCIDIDNPYLIYASDRGVISENYNLVYHWLFRKRSGLLVITDELWSDLYPHKSSVHVIWFLLSIVIITMFELTVTTTTATINLLLSLRLYVSLTYEVPT